MTRQQKIILIALGILDLIVVVGLGAIVAGQMAPQMEEIVVTPPPDDACTAALLSALSMEDNTATVAWDQEIAHLTISYASAQDDLSEAQHLWLVLDALPAPLPTICPVPQTVLISIRLPSGTVHTAQIAGADLVAWLTGAQSDEELAGRALYRAVPHAPIP